MTGIGSPNDFEALLDYLKRTRGFDFSAYKRSSLMRRVEKRMQGAKVNSYLDYIDYLEVHPDEFTLLFNTIPINVTAFFRDPESWEYLQTEMLPKLVEAKGNGPIRVWSAGCASGEEAYSLAIVLAEIMGPQRFSDQAKIYATDVDEEALAQARLASYDEKAVEGLPPGLLHKYFDRNGGHHTFNKDLRRSIIFGRHDLIQDSPISRLDLVVCRNTLMYFNAEFQAKILARFHFALTDGGLLFLGKAETIFTHANSFGAVDIKRRIFRKVEKGTLRDRLLIMNQAGGEPAVNHLLNHVRVRENAADSIPIAQLVVDQSGALVQANSQARMLFNLNLKDMGRPLQDLEVSYRPVELRSLIDQSYQEHRTITIKDVAWISASGQSRFLEVRVAPLYDPSGMALGVSVTFEDVTRYRQLQDDLVRSNQELETAMEELQSTNEELETTNEELQSTVEELETTNEELQSTNEELETMNEELQSTNEELSTMNDELRKRSEDLNLANLQLESILTSFRRGIVVVDRDLRVQIWNRRAMDMWGLRQDEVVGKNILGLDIGLPVEQLKQPIRECMSANGDEGEDGKPLVLAATNRRGKAVDVAVTCVRLNDREDGVLGVILLMDEPEPSRQPQG